MLSAFVCRLAPSGSADGSRGDLLERMLATMPYRCTDRTGFWVEEGVGMGHGIRHTTPESAFERLPAMSPCGRYVLVSDSRIDNRASLIDALDARGAGRPGDRKPVTDSDLIMLAYRRWGSSCLDHLVGDFAFAIFDRKNRHLFCARDHFGLRSLYYHHEAGKSFSAATEVKALLVQPEIPGELDEQRLADLLAEIRGGDNTIYRGIRRLPPAHFMEVDGAGRLRIERYYELAPAGDVSPDLDDHVYAERFHELFEEAVRCRLRSLHPVASDLSGGLDSSYVTCVARDLLHEEGRAPLHTFSHVFDGEGVAESDERYYIHAVLDQADADLLEPHFLRSEDLGPLSGLGRVYDSLDDYLVAGTHYLVSAKMPAVERSGARILLDGLDGDHTVSHGILRLVELVREERWSTYVEEIFDLARSFSSADHLHAGQERYRSPLRMVSATWSPILDEYADSGEWWKLFAAVRGLRSHFQVKQTRLWVRYLRRMLSRAWLRRRGERRVYKAPGVPPSVAPTFAQRLDLPTRMERRHDPLDAGWKEKIRLSVRQHQQQVLSGDKLARGLEAMGHLAASYGIELRHPFMDKRLIEFCLALPPEQSLKNGRTRYVLHGAMKGTVPPAISNRVGKGRMSASFRHGLLEVNAEALRELIQHPGVLAPYIDWQHVSRMYDDRHSLSEADLVTLGQIATLAFWMNKRFKLDEGGSIIQRDDAPARQATSTGDTPQLTA